MYAERGGALRRREIMRGIYREEGKKGLVAEGSWGREEMRGILRRKILVK